MRVFSLNVFPSDKEDTLEKIDLSIEKCQRESWPYVLDFHPHVSFFLSKNQLLSIAKSITDYFNDEKRD